MAGSDGGDDVSLSFAGEQPFNVIIADPPWSFSDKLGGETRGAAAHYTVMRQSGIEDYVSSISLPVADDALLFMWRVASQPEEAIRVVRAWGFTPKSEVVWVKSARNGGLRIGMGRYVRNAHEVCVVASKGRGTALVRDHGTPSVITANRGEHSAKPDEFYVLVERLVGGPASVRGIELFARRPRDGWTCVGNELPDGVVRGGVQ